MVDNFDRIKTKLQSKCSLDGKIMNTFIWGKTVKINYTQLVEKLQIIYDKIKDYDFSDTSSTNLKLNVDI